MLVLALSLSLYENDLNVVLREVPNNFFSIFSADYFGVLKQALKSFFEPRFRKLYPLYLSHRIMDMNLLK